jgi:hypothetical protein
MRKILVDLLPLVRSYVDHSAPFQRALEYPQEARDHAGMVIRHRFGRCSIAARPRFRSECRGC